MHLVDKIESPRIVQIDLAKTNQSIRVFGNSGFGGFHILRFHEKKSEALHRIESCDQFLQKRGVAVVMNMNVDQLWRGRLGVERVYQCQNRQDEKGNCFAQGKISDSEFQAGV